MDAEGTGEYTGEQKREARQKTNARTSKPLSFDTIFNPL